ncbi:MAG TPA: TRAP transporter small permease [bacterium]|jgi:TRAP-type C4-dicarboxylate transport system permease small subunit|nr:TRAP transporter small permease [bacterium]
MALGEEGRGEPPVSAGLGVLTPALNRLIALLEAYCIVLMVGMAVIVLTGVFYRYVIERALPWYDEFAEFLLVWLTFYGSVLATQRRAHIGFETLIDYLPAPVRRGFELAAEVIMLLVQGALFYYGWTLVQAASFDRAVSLPSVRLNWIYSAIPISGALMFLISFSRLARLLRRARP